MRKTLALFLLCCILLSSCITPKKYDYIANINEIVNAWKAEIGPYYDPIYFPGDALSIISAEDRPGYYINPFTGVIFYRNYFSYPKTSLYIMAVCESKIVSFSNFTLILKNNHFTIMYINVKMSNSVSIGSIVHPQQIIAEAANVSSYIGLRMFYKNIEFDPYFIIFNR